MKRLADGVAVLLLAVLLSACGSQPEQAYGGQTESLKPTGQAEASQPEAEESVGESAEQNSSGNEKTVENNFADGEDTEKPKGGGSVAEENPFDFETKTVTLNSGYEMPIYGLGTYSLTGKTCVDSVTAALNSGVRLIDTAYMYHNEESVGEAVRNSGIPREEIFVITKLYPNQFSDPEAAIEEALEKLDVSYIDMMLLHHPGAGDVDAYLAMEKAVEEGKIRSIGLSNWYVEELEAFLPQVNVTPALVQNEIHPYYQENDVIPYIQGLGIVVQGWYPLGGRGYTAELLGNEVISEIARAHGKSSAQVILRWNLQKGVVVIPGSSNPDHIRENTELFDFELTEEEMERAIEIGAEMVDMAHNEGSNIISFGEMGIANTSSSSLWMTWFTGISLKACVGAGSGLNPQGIEHKYNILRAAMENYRGDGSPRDIIRWFGGYEMVAAVGAMLRAAERRMLIIVDGFIMTNCVLAAKQLYPAVQEYCIFGHQGDEAGHQLVLEFLDAKPLLNLSLRLGEGTGAICAYPIIESAIRMVNEMTTFQQAQITKYF